jgi:hypothetical protein
MVKQYEYTDTEFGDFVAKAQRPFGRSMHMPPVYVPDPAAVCNAAQSAYDHWDTVLNLVVPKAVEAALNIRLGLRYKSANRPVEYKVDREGRFPNLKPTAPAFAGTVEVATPRPGFTQRISQLPEETYRAYTKRLQRIADTEGARLSVSERMQLAEVKKAAIEHLGELEGWPKIFDCVYDGPPPHRPKEVEKLDRQPGETNRQWLDRLEAFAPTASRLGWCASERLCIAQRIGEVKTLLFVERREADRKRQVAAEAAAALSA